MRTQRSRNDSDTKLLVRCCGHIRTKIGSKNHARLLDMTELLRGTPKRVAFEGNILRHERKLRALYCQAAFASRISREGRIVDSH